MEPNTSRPHASDRRPRRPEAVLLEIARHGVVRWEDAKSAGLNNDVVLHRIETGFLSRDRRGVYRLAGSARVDLSAETAALAATRSRALGLWSANAANGVSKGVASSRVHVMVERPAKPRSTNWYEVHTTRRIADDEVRMRDGRPVTTVARTLRDFAAFLPPKDWADRHLVQWTEEALIQKTLTLRKLERQVTRERASRVRARLTRVLEYHQGTDPQVLRSIGETWLRDLIVRRSLPMPLFNCRPMGGVLSEADAYFPDVPLIIEFDGFAYHHTRTKHDRDRRRDRIARRHGIETMRITETDFAEDRDQLERDIELLVLGETLLP